MVRVQLYCLVQEDLFEQLFQIGYLLLDLVHLVVPQVLLVQLLHVQGVGLLPRDLTELQLLEVFLELLGFLGVLKEEVFTLTQPLGIEGGVQILELGGFLHVIQEQILKVGSPFLDIEDQILLLNVHLYSLIRIPSSHFQL